MMVKQIKLEGLTSIETALSAIFSKDDNIIIGLYDDYMEFYGVKNGVEYIFRVRKGLCK